MEKLPGSSLLRNPLKNRGSAFTDAERQQLSIEGLLPASVQTQAQQVARVYQILKRQESPLEMYRELAGLQDRNEYLYYRVLIEHLPELMPIVYTPTVGEAAQNYSAVFQRERGIWITPNHRGRVQQVLENAVGDRDIKLIVATDNEAILGLGDQGAGGMTISIGKLALYTACAGIAPESTLPISLDVGTNNQTLIDNPDYLGLNQPRLRGKAYEDLLEEFVTAVESMFPGAMIQWEDFSKDNALNILDRYRGRIPSFNDDIQGTGAVTLAGIFSALRIKQESLNEQRVLIYGAGAAGLGIARQIKAAFREAGIRPEELDQHIGLLDSRGLLVADREISDSYKHELAWAKDSALAIGLTDPQSRSLAAVVDAFKPTILVGSSGQAGAFDEKIVRSLASYCQRPVIMPLSNPTSAAEATPSDLLTWTEGSAIVATGSPFDPVKYGDATHRFGQGNNVFIFPGLGYATLLGNIRSVSDSMITASAKALAESMLQEELKSGQLYPDVSRLRETTAAVTKGVLLAAINEGLTSLTIKADLDDLIEQSAWSPNY